MTDITVKIAAKGCDNTGITDEIANRLHANLGHKIVAVVELVSEARTEKRDGNEAVTLSILTLEPAPDTQTTEHLRELARAFHFERRLEEGDPGQMRLDDNIEPKVADVIAAGHRHTPHPFLPDDAAKDTPICDLCGGIEASAVHEVQDELDVNPGDENGGDTVTGPDTATNEAHETELAEEDEPHSFVSEDDVDSCRLCGRHEDDGQGIHVTDDNQGATVTPFPGNVANPFNPGA